jgi:hypothetical protein
VILFGDNLPDAMFRQPQTVRSGRPTMAKSCDSACDPQWETNFNAMIAG